MKRVSWLGAVVALLTSALVVLAPMTANATTADAVHPHTTAAHSAQAAPAAVVADVVNCDGRNEQFVRGSDGALWHRWQTTPGGSWSNWHSLGGYLIYDVDAVTNVNCHLEAFGVGGDHAMWHIWQTNPGNGPWSGWNSLGGYLISRPYAGVSLNGDAFVAAFGSDHNLWCDAQARPANGPWTGWYHNAGNYCP